MYSRRLVQLLMVAFSILIATRAAWFHHNNVEARDISVGLDAADSSPSAADETTPAPTTSDEPTPTDSETDADTSTTSESTSTTEEPTTSDPPPPTTTPTSSTSSTSSTTSTTDNGPITTPPTSEPSSTPPPTSSTDNPGNPGNPDNSDTETTPQESQTHTEPPVTRTRTVFYTTTDGSGSTHVGSSEAVVVSTPGFSGGSDGAKSQDKGITSMTRSIIIGVTVGIGGAIILAAAGVLYWRLRNKRRSQEENEELISYGAGFGGPGTAEKTEASAPSAGARSPFQSTLETYHAPTQTNAASNF